MRKWRQNAVGQQIQRLRIQASLSQDQLAARCGVIGWDISRATLAKIESSVRRVSDAELFILALALKADLANLFPKNKSQILAALRA